MEVKQIMSREVEVIHSHIPVQTAAEKMKALDVGMLPVRDGDLLVGTVTDRDIVVRAIAGGKDPSTTEIKEILTPDVVYCFEDQDVREAAQLMQENNIRRLIVLNRDKRLAGIVSIRDLAGETVSGKPVKRVFR